MSNLNALFFGVYPYIAIGVCLVGSWIRFDREQYTWKAGSSQLLSGGREFRIANNLFHVGVLFILVGHFVGLLTPEAIYHHFISTQAKQVLAMVSGGIFGAMALVGLHRLVKRRFTDDRVKVNSSKSDNMVLLLLYAQLVLGLLTIFVSLFHLDGSVMVRLADWAQSIVTLQPAQAVEAISSVNFIYKLHVFLGLTIIVVFPFTRLVHMISAPIWYLGRNYQIVRKKVV